MVRIKVGKRSEGAVPTEEVLEISTVEGTEEVVVHTSQVTEKGVEVGFIREADQKVLVELPRETMSGKWRVWVPKGALA